MTPGTTMTKPSINLMLMPYDVMLLIEYPSGVTYRHQAGGTLCWRPELEGVLAPIDISDAHVEEVMKLPYDHGLGISAAIADGLDAILAANPGSRYLTVDRDRMNESMEAWVHVCAETKDDSLE